MPRPNPSTDLQAERADRLTGVLLGTAAGDTLGLPREGLSRRRALRLFGPSPLRQRFLLGRGMISDDTEHACMSAQALLAAPDDDARFARSLARRLQGWLAALPGGVGFGTLRAILKLWLGFPPARSGVRSAGNGAAMRAPLLGACFAHQPERLEALVLASTRITHRDPRAEEGALAIALAAAHAARSAPGVVDRAALLGEIQARIHGEELRRRLEHVALSLDRGASPTDFAAGLGLGEGVSGFIFDTVPAALFCWLRSPDDLRRAVEEVILLGGDADSTGAIVGGLAGASVGAKGVPAEWLAGIAEWPRSVRWMRRLGARLAGRFPAPGQEVAPEAGPLALFWPALPARNLLFLAIALAHGFRRLFPPY